MYFRSQRKLNNEVSINETIDVDRDGNPLTYIDVISCDDTVAEDLDRKMQTEKMMRMLRTALCERERQIIVMRYGLFGHKARTQREVADMLGISRSYVSRIEKSALEKLRTSLDGHA
jgi:RNA polymerase sporulation-specific sigma factor